MPRCYMVKKGAPPQEGDPAPGSPTEASVAPPGYQPPEEHRTNTESADTAAEYAELRSAPISERSAADTEAAHELLSLAAGVPPLPPAAVLTVLRSPEPVIPVYTYAIQPTTIYFLTEEQPEPMYRAVQTIPLQQIVHEVDPQPRTFSTTFINRNRTYSCDGMPPVYQLLQRADWSTCGSDNIIKIDYSSVDNHQQVSYVAYHEGLPPPPPLQFNPQSNTQTPPGGFNDEPCQVSQYAPLTTISIEEVSTDSTPELIAVQVPVIEPVPQQHQAQPPPQSPPQPPPQPSSQPPSQPPPPPPVAIDLDPDSDEDTLCIVTTKEKPNKFICNECGKQYATSSNLSRHKQTHRSLDSNSAKKCGECGKVYVSMPALAMHLLTHRMGHVCGVCGKQFSRPWLLRGHVRSHTGEKPYNCASCGKAFADRSNLRAHLQTHTPDKKYDCKRCNKIFALKSYLHKHQESGCRGDEDGAAA